MNTVYKLLLVGGVLINTLHAYTLSAEKLSESAPACRLFFSEKKRTFELYGSLLIFQPSASNLSYTAQAVPFPLPSPHWNIFEIRPRYHAGFDIGCITRWTMPSTHLSLNWEHLHSSDHAALQVAETSFVGPFFEIGPDAGVYHKAHGRVSCDHDAVNLSAGYDLHPHTNLRASVITGIRAARIKQERCNRYSNYDDSIIRSLYVPSLFVGAGPRAAVDFDYYFSKGFSLTGTSAFSLLVGILKNHTLLSATSPALASVGITPPNLQTICVEKRTGVVPCFEQKLAISYAYSSCGKYQVGVQVGYAAELYGNALQSVDINSQVITPPVDSSIGVYVRTFERTLSSFSLFGPYIRMSVYF